MSRDYEVIVAEADWPSGSDFQRVLDGRPGAVRVESLESWEEKSEETWEPTFPISVAGQAVGLWLDVSRIGSGDETSASEKALLIDMLHEEGIDSSAVVDGAYLCCITRRGGSEEVLGAKELIRALTHEFGGFGFETQYLTHGRLDWLSQLERVGEL